MCVCTNVSIMQCACAILSSVPCPVLQYFPHYLLNGTIFEKSYRTQNVCFDVLYKQRLNWLGHVERMAEDNKVQTINRWKPMSKRPIGRPKTRWENDVLEYIRNMNVHNWKKMAQNRDSWKKAVEQARTLYRL